MKVFAKIVFFTMVGILQLTLVSCNKDKTQKQEVANPSPEQAKMLETYKKSMEESKKTVVARVNGVNITMFELLKEMNEIGQQHIKSGEKRDPKLDEKVRKEALDRLIYVELAVQAAIRKGMGVPPQRIDYEFNKGKAALKTEEAYKKRLETLGLTEEGLKKQIERDILVDMITEEEIFKKVKIDPEQVKETYAREKASYKDPSGKQMSFEAARPLIEEKLMTAAVHKREDQWIEELKKTARIDIVLGESAKKIHDIN
jgi:hypothetical protein